MKTVTEFPLYVFNPHNDNNNKIKTIIIIIVLLTPTADFDEL